MIQRISAVSVIAKQPIRSNLKNVGKLRPLAGNSLSRNIPHFMETNMVVPGGFNLKEKVYYLLTKNVPPTVRERWFAQTDSYNAVEGDDIITVKTHDGTFVGEVIDGPSFLGLDDGISAADIGSDTIGTDSVGLDDVSGTDSSLLDLFSGTLMI